MRIHTFEKKLSVAEFFSAIKNKIKTSFEIDENSYADEFNLLIIGINEKDQSVIIRGLIDKSKDRIYLSILAIQSNLILNQYKLVKKTHVDQKELGKILFDIVKTSIENDENFAFSNLAIKTPIDRKFQIQLVEIEKQILIKLLESLDENENNSIILGKHPFSILDMDGSWDTWQNLYGPYIDFVENNLITANNKSFRTFRNYNFAFNTAYHQRIADLIIFEVEEQISNPISKKTEDKSKKSYVKIEDQYSDKIEEEIRNLKITFVFANKKKQQLKLIQMLKLTDEVKNFIKLLHKKELKQYSKIDPQIIFISLFGFEATVGDYLRNNLHRNSDENLSILIVPPVKNNLWNNYFVKDSIKIKNDYNRNISGLNFKDFNELRKKSTFNQRRIQEMETHYEGVMKTKKISENNSEQLKFWADNLSINNSSSLLDIRNSRETINHNLLIEI